MPLINKNMKTKSRHRSFTLIELLMVIGIIMILAGIAIPNFAKAKERALTKEAIANLKLIAAAERVYRMENLTYYGPTGNIGLINSNLKLYFTNETYWDYTITVATADTFTATAARLGGPYAGCTFTLTHNDVDGEPNPSGTCP
jgi:type II secretory pathway pseudopilin PulG